MKKLIFKAFPLFLTAAIFLAGCAANGHPAAAQASSVSGVSSVDKSKLGKVLIVYYSLLGHTSEIANTIKDITGGDIFEIQPVDNYFRNDIEEIAKKQINEGYKPKLKNSISNIDAYDFIFIGSPVWWFSVSTPVMSFLSEYDLTGKKVIPFCTYGSNYGQFFRQFKAACPGAQVLEGNDFTNSEAKDMDQVKEKIKIWLNKIAGKS